LYKNGRASWMNPQTLSKNRLRYLKD